MTRLRSVSAVLVLLLASGGCVWEQEIWVSPEWSFGSGPGGWGNADWTGDGRYLLYGNWEDNSLRLRLRDMVSGDELVEFGPDYWDLYGWSVSGDGRYIAFTRRDPDCCGPGQIHLIDVYLHDRQTSTDTLISVNEAGDLRDGWSVFPEISDDGSVVVFESRATNLVPDDTNGATDVFSYTVATGELELLSRTPAGQPANSSSRWPVVSADGSVVAFESYATDLVSGDTNGKTDIFSSEAGTIVRRSVATGGGQANGPSRESRISADGSTVTFQSAASNLVPGGTTSWDIYASDASGLTEQVNLGPDGVPVSGATEYSLANYDLSGDGSLVLFGRTFGSSDSGALLRDRQAQITQVASADASGTPQSGVYGAFITDDGRSVLYAYDTEVSPGTFVDRSVLRPALDPVVESVSTSVVGPGSRSVTFDGVGFHDPTVIRAIGRPGVTFSNATVVDRGTMTATMTVAPGTPAGPVSVSVTVPRSPIFGPGVGGVAVCSCFTVML